MRPRPNRQICALFGLLVLAAGLAGCYERVVSAKGLGAERIETQQPYQQDTSVDRWWYGNGSEPKPR